MHGERTSSQPEGRSGICRPRVGRSPERTRATARSATSADTRDADTTRNGACRTSDSRSGGARSGGDHTSHNCSRDDGSGHSNRRRYQVTLSTRPLRPALSSMAPPKPEGPAWASRCNEADRKGSQPCRKKRLSLHQASPLVLGLFPGTPLPYRSYRTYGRRQPLVSPHPVTTSLTKTRLAMPSAPAPPAGL